MVGLPYRVFLWALQYRLVRQNLVLTLTNSRVIYHDTYRRIFFEFLEIETMGYTVVVGIILHYTWSELIFM